MHRLQPCVFSPFDTVCRERDHCMNEEFQRAIFEVAEHLLDAARTDDHLRSSLRLCAQEILALTAALLPQPSKIHHRR